MLRSVFTCFHAEASAAPGLTRLLGRVRVMVTGSTWSDAGEDARDPTVTGTARDDLERNGDQVQVVIVGAGPTGLYTAIALARRGHAVTVIERDRGPAGAMAWDRIGVMQFFQPHVFRAPVFEALGEELPDVLQRLLDAGATPYTVPDAPGRVLGLRCRRLLLEGVLRRSALDQDRVDVRVGHADAVARRGGRAIGVVVDGALVDADLVIDASGRAGRLTRTLRAAPEGSDSGTAYVSRRYRLLDGAQPGPMNMPFGFAAERLGYVSLVFGEDNGFFSTIVIRATRDPELAELRSVPAFDAVMAVLPACAEWTAPDRSQPAGPVRPGGGLFNRYAGQLDDSGRVPLDGLVVVGDTVCTTNPSAARGTSTSLAQARKLLDLLVEFPDDLSACTAALDSWCDTDIRPWFLDQVRNDEAALRRWAGDDIDFSAPLASDVVCAAAEQAPELTRYTNPYLAMAAPPDILDAAELRAREVYRTGWRPPEDDGPTRAELVDLIQRTIS